MGFYINPKDMSKEHWFDKNAFPNSISRSPKVRHYIPESDTVACVLVNNGAFTALGICYSQRELEDFARNDGRQKLWGHFPRSLVEPYLFGQEVEGVNNDEPREHIESS